MTARNQIDQRPDYGAPLLFFFLFWQGCRSSCHKLIPLASYWLQSIALTGAAKCGPRITHGDDKMLAVESRRQDTFSEQAVAGPSSKPILAPIPRCPTSHSLRSTAGTEGRSGASSPSTIRRPPSRTEKNFVCGYPGCNKAYYKPSRLAEHELTHTGLVSLRRVGRRSRADRVSP